MDRLGRTLRVAAALLAGAAAVSAAVLEGVALEDHSGFPLPSVRVRVRAPNGEVVADRDTDSSGRFVTSELEPGAYRVEFSKPNSLPTAAEVVIPAAPLVVRLTRTGAVAGTVTASGQPSAETTVFAWARDGSAWRPVATAWTKRDGAYRLHGLPPGDYAVGTSRSSFQNRERAGTGATLYPNNTAPRMFRVTGGEEYRNIDFAFIGAGRTVSGRVQGADAKSRFAVGLAHAELPLLSLAVTQTDDEGRFSLASVPSGAYELFAAGPVRGYSQLEAILGDAPRLGRTRVEVAGADVGGLEIAAAPGRTAEIAYGLEIAAAAGNCPASATVELVPQEAWGVRIARTVPVAANAPARLEDLAPARYSVRVRDLPAGCFAAGEATLDLAEADGRATALATPGGWIEGRLRGGAPGAWTIFVRPREPGGPGDGVRIAYPGPEGAFAFSNLRPGHYAMALIRRDDTSPVRFDLGRAFELEVLGASATTIEIPTPPEADR